MITFWFLHKDENNIPVSIVKGIQFDTVTMELSRGFGDKVGTEWDMDIDLELFRQLYYYNIDYRVSLINKDKVSTLDTNVIWISIPGFFELKTTLNNIPKEVLEFAKINNATIIINNARESFEGSPPGKYSEKVISNFIKRKKFPNHLIKIIINNHGLPNNITKPEYFRPINYLPGFMVQYTVSNSIKHDIKEKKYNFCCMAGQTDTRPWRLEFLAKALESGLIDERFFFTHLCYNPNETREILEKFGGFSEKVINKLASTYLIDLYGKEMKGTDLQRDALPDVPSSEPAWNLPPQALSSHVYIALESRINCSSITEKPFKPIISKLPFLIIGHKNLHHGILCDMGFKLYDEVFDYSFDLADNIHDRIDLLLKELQRLKNSRFSIDLEGRVIGNAHDLTTEKFEILKPKLEHNYNNFMKIANDKSNWMYSLGGSDLMNMVINIGFSHTGTSSLAKALEILGYFVMDDAIVQEWNSTGGHTRTNYSHIFINNFKNGKKIFDDFIPKYNAFTAHPGTDYRFLEKLLLQYPNAYFIYTYREHLSQDKEPIDEVIRKYQNLKILKFNVCDEGHGWKELCGFLNKKIPNVNFPHLNKS